MAHEAAPLMTGARRGSHDVARPVRSALAALVLVNALGACDRRGGAASRDAGLALSDGPAQTGVCAASGQETPLGLASPPFGALATDLDIPDDATPGGSSRLGAGSAGVYAATRRGIQLFALHAAAPVAVVPDVDAVTLVPDGARLYWLRVVDSSWHLYASDGKGGHVAELGAGAAGRRPRLAVDEDDLYVSGPCRNQAIVVIPKDGGAMRPSHAPCDDDDLREYDFLSVNHGFAAWTGIAGDRDEIMLSGPATWTASRRHLPYAAVVASGASFFGLEVQYDGARRTRDIRVDAWAPDRPETRAPVGVFPVATAGKGATFDIAGVEASGGDLIVVTDDDDGPSVDLWHLRGASQDARLLARMPRGSHVAVGGGHVYVASRGVLYGAELSALDAADRLRGGCGAPRARDIEEAEGGEAPTVGFEQRPWSAWSAAVPEVIAGSSLLAAEDGLYVSTVRGIERVAPGGGEPVLRIPGASAIAMHRDAEFLYWIERREAVWELFRGDTSGSHHTVLAHGAAGPATSLASDQEYLYVTGPCSAQAVTAVPKRGGPAARWVAPCAENGASAPGYVGLWAAHGYLAYRTSTSAGGDVHLAGPGSWRPGRATLPFDRVATDGVFFYGEALGHRPGGWRHPLWRWIPEHPETAERIGHLEDGVGEDGGALVVDGNYALSLACPADPVTCTLNVLDIGARHAAPIALAAASELHGVALRDGVVFVHYGTSIYRAELPAFEQLRPAP